MAPPSRLSLSGAMNASGNTGLLHAASAATQGTERTDPRFNSMRSRAMSSMLSTSTAAASSPLDHATARGPWALFCFKVRDSRISRGLLILAVLFDWLGVILEASNMATPALAWSSHALVLLGFICVVVTGAGSRGLWSDRHAYLRSWSGWLDTIFLLNILVDLFYQLGVNMEWWTYTPAAMAVISLLRNLRAWVVLRICRTFRAAITQIGRSAGDLGAVCIFVLVFSLLVLIVLLHFYGFACWYRCYPDLPLPPEVQASDSCSADSFFWDVDENQFRFCSDQQSPCKEGTSCRNIFLHSVTSSCNAEERKSLQDRAWLELQTNEEAAFGVMGLQTLGAAAVTLLQGFTLEGWALTMQRQVDGDHRSNGLVAYIVFPSMVVIGGMLLMNLCIAVLWEAFDAAQSEQITRPSILRESEWRVYQLLGMDWIKYLMVQLSENWELAKVTPCRTPKNDKNESQKGDVHRKFCSCWTHMTFQITSAIERQFPELKNRLQFFYKALTGFAFRVATHRFVSPLMLAVVATDITCLLVESGTGSGPGFTIVYITTSVIFVGEAIVLLLAFGGRGIKDGFIFLDIMTACLAVVDGVLALNLCPSLNGCRAAMVDGEGPGGTVGVVLSLLRPIRILKVVKYFSTLRMTAEMLVVLHTALIPYLLLVFYACTVMAQLGLLLFFDPKYLSVHANGHTLSVTKYLNFINPGNSILLLLTILTGEGWDLFFKELAQVYGGHVNKFDFNTNKLSDFVLTASFRVTAINAFLYFALLFLNCLIFNLYGAVMIGHYIQTKKSLAVKYASKFIVTCRKAGIAMPAEDALQGENAHALYAGVDMTTDRQRDELIKVILLGSDHGKSAKALGVFARKTSQALDICKAVARKGSRFASRGSSGSISWTADRSNTRSNGKLHSPEDIPQGNKLMNDFEFDRAVAQHALHHPGNPAAAVKSASPAARATARTGRESGVGLTNSKGSSVGTDSAAEGDKEKPSSTSLLLDDILIGPLAETTSTKKGIQFAEEDETVILPDSRAELKAFSASVSTNYPIKRVFLIYCALQIVRDAAGSVDKPGDELQFTELCSMLGNAIKDALKHAGIALTATVHAALVQITPTDPDSPALQMAYVGHLVSDAYEVSSKPRSTAGDGRHNQQHTSLGISSLRDLGNKSGSNASITLRRRTVGDKVPQHWNVRQLPHWMQALIAKQRAASAHLRNTCGISGIGWLQLFLQLASLVELVVECSMERNISSMRLFGYIELGFQAALTVQVLLQLALSFTSEGIPFFGSRSNCWDLALQVAAWCSLAVPLARSKGELDSLMLESAWYRIAQCCRVLRSVWLLRVWRGTGLHRLVLALQVAGRRILDLGFIFILLVTFFAVDFRYLLEPVAGDPPAVPLPHANLTSLGESFLSVFILTTSEGWPRVLTDFLDLGDRHHTLTIILCAMVVALLSVFVMNLFVGVIVEVLDKEQANLEYTGGVRSATVLRWNEVQRAIFSSNATAGATQRRGAMLQEGRRGTREWLKLILTSKQLDIAVAVVSLASCLTMMVAGAWAETDVRWYFPSVQTWIFWLNAIIVVAYVIEQGLRVWAFEKVLLQKTIYTLDLAVATSSLAALIVGLSTSLRTPFPAEPLWPVAFRMVRVAYVVCQRMPVMRVISITMLNVVGALGRVLLLLAAIILFYGLIGTCLFYDAPINPKLHSTFASLFDSIVLLMSCCTGENWHDIMLQARSYYYEQGSIGLGWLIVAYAVTFVIMAFLLLMNVFMSTVLKGYVDTKRNQSLWRVAQQHQELLTKWRLREMKLSWLPIHVAVQVLTEIPPPIGFKNQYIDMGSRRMEAILASMAAYPLPVHENKMHIRDVVLTTTCRACEAHALRRETLATLDPSQQQQTVELNPRLVSGWMSRFTDIAGLTPEFNVLQYLAAIQIQAFWRTHKVLQRNNAIDQLLFMKHLLFLLETSAPICARKSSRSDNRRSTLRRKRGTKASSSFARKSMMLPRLGTFARNAKAQQHPKEKIKNALNKAATGGGALRMHHATSPEHKVSTASLGSQRRSQLQEEELHRTQQRQRQKSLHRSTASECIVDVGQGEGTETFDPRSNLDEEELSAQFHQVKKAALSREGSEDARNTWEASTGAAALPDAALALTAAAAQLSVASSSTVTRFSIAAPATAECATGEPPNVTTTPLRGSQTSPTHPTRSSMRPPQPVPATPLPRRSLRIVPTPAIDAATASNDPPRRRGQSVQFTGVDRLELQKLLVPSLQARDSVESSNEETSQR